MSEAISGQGIISPSPKGSDSKFKASLIMNEQEYLVQPKGAGADFIDLLGTSISVQGLITPASEEEDFPIIFVKSYKIIDDLDDLDWFGKAD